MNPDLLSTKDPILRQRLSREESREQTRKLLLNSARQLFAKLGYAGCSVDAIAEAAGFSKGAFYSNFETKDAIFLELLKNHKAMVMGDMRTLIESEEDAFLVLEKVRTYLEEQEMDPCWCLLSLEFQLVATRDPAFHAQFVELFRAERAQISSFVSALFAKAQVPLPVDAEQIAAALIALFQGLQIQNLTDPKVISIGTPSSMLALFQGALLQRK
jgi:AcrR family transcriptional regulator